MLLAALLACTDDAAPPQEAAHLEEGGVQRCAAPELREAAPLDDVPGTGMFDAALWPEETHMGVATADFDGDGVLDFATAGPSDRARLWMARGGVWAEESERLPVAEPMKGAGLTAVDLDADGDMDLSVPRADGPTHLWENDGQGNFSDITEARGLPMDIRTMHQVSWSDMDLDGDLDAFVIDFVGNGEDLPDVPDSRSELWIQQEDGSFDVARSRIPARAEDAFILAGGFLDLNRDRLPDLYLMSDFGHIEPSVAALNTGPARGSVFEAAPELGLDIAMSGMGLGIADLNGDGLPDLALSDTAGVPLMMSTEAGWFDEGLAMGLDWTDGAAWGIALEDMDNNGELDLIFSVGPVLLEGGSREDADSDNRDVIYLQQDGVWTRAEELWDLSTGGQGAGLAISDLDGDGWLDIVRIAWLGPSEIKKARCGENAWLMVDLEQPGLNRDAIGAEVVVKAGGRTWRRQVLAGTASFASSTPPDLHFGLGDVDEVDAILVTWPDGRVDDLGPVESRQRVRITHP